jgi:hypothetical protein
MKLKWQQAPVKTQWGDDMVVASVAIDNDHTLSLYCERDQAPKVDAMFAQRTWVGLTPEETLEEAHKEEQVSGFIHGASWASFKLRERNT